jgi:RNA polymerase sigma-70 factor (ECF subfamily)
MHATAMLTALAAEHESLVRLAYRFCWNRADAEDAVQSAFVIAAARSGQVRQSGKHLAWMRSIVVRQSLERLRRAKRERRAQLATIRPAASHCDRDPTAADELADLLRELLPLLPERPRIAVVLRHLENMDYAELAAVMEIEPSTARVLVRNGRERLRELMLERYPEWGGEGRSP